MRSPSVAPPCTAALLYASRYVNVPGIEALGAIDPRLRVFLDMWRMAADAALNDDLESAGLTFPSTVSTTAEKVDMNRGLSVIEYYDELARGAHTSDMEHVFSPDDVAGDLFHLRRAV